jgi:hypothetical protein
VVVHFGYIRHFNGEFTTTFIENNSFPENGKGYFFMLLCKCIYIYGKFLSKKWQLLIV